jgi:hypothetical protein
MQKLYSLHWIVHLDGPNNRVIQKVCSKEEIEDKFHQNSD